MSLSVSQLNEACNVCIHFYNGISFHSYSQMSIWMPSAIIAVRGKSYSHVVAVDWLHAFSLTFLFRTVPQFVTSCRLARVTWTLVIISTIERLADWRGQSWSPHSTVFNMYQLFADTSALPRLFSRCLRHCPMVSMCSIEKLTQLCQVWELLPE